MAHNCGMPKLAFVGTNAWFFLCVNFLKLPFQVFAWHNINLTTLTIDACAIPFVLIGAFLGIRLVKFLPEKGFRIFTTVVTIISVLVTSRKMLRQFQLSTGLRMKIYTKTNFFLAEIKQKSWISCYF